jgi:NAD+ kinase
MKKVILSPNPFRDRGFRTTLEAERILRESGLDTRICLPFYMDSDGRTDVRLFNMDDELPGSDLLICFGGDGTILHASKLVLDYGIPILGINTGSMGFMAELEATELNLLSRISHGDYDIEHRMMLDVEVWREGKIIYSDSALNDAVITKGAVARVIQLSVFCDGVEASSFTGDGVIVCTPTGSTAYSVSAGGPIVEATARNIIITPICAHTMNAQCLVTAKDRAITVRIVRIGKRNAFLSVDGGKAVRLGQDDEIRLHRSAHETKLMKLKGTSFYRVVREKLGAV